MGRKLKKSEDHVLAELWESDGYKFLVQSIDELIHIFHETESIDRDELLINRVTSGTCDLAESNFEQTENIDQEASVEPEIEELIEEPIEQRQPDVAETGSTDQQEVLNTDAGIEVLFGTNLKNDHKVFWGSQTIPTRLCTPIRGLLVQWVPVRHSLRSR